MPRPDPDVAAHLEWLGFVQSAGLVVPATALVKAGAVLNRHDAEGQRLLRACAAERRLGTESEPRPWLPDFSAFAASVLGWNFSPGEYAGTDERPVPSDGVAALRQTPSGGRESTTLAVVQRPTGLDGRTICAWISASARRPWRVTTPREQDPHGLSGL